MRNTESKPQKIRNYGWDRYLLSKNLSLDELNQLEEIVKAEHANERKNGSYFENGEPTISLINKSGLRKLDAIGWAIYNKTKKRPSPCAQCPNTGHKTCCCEGC